jgi:hypothetical protein
VLHINTLLGTRWKKKEHADLKKKTPTISIEKKPLQIQRGEPFYREDDDFTQVFSE